TYSAVLFVSLIGSSAVCGLSAFNLSPVRRLISYTPKSDPAPGRQSKLHCPVTPTATRNLSTRTGRIRQNPPEPARTRQNPALTYHCFQAGLSTATWVNVVWAELVEYIIAIRKSSSWINCPALVA